MRVLSQTGQSIHTHADVTIGIARMQNANKQANSGSLLVALVNTLPRLVKAGSLDEVDELEDSRNEA